MTHLSPMTTTEHEFEDLEDHGRDQQRVLEGAWLALEPLDLRGNHGGPAWKAAPTLLAYSGHASVASLARYTRVSPDALTRWQARRDPADTADHGSGAP